MKRSETANREGGTMAEEKKPFVRREEDEITFNLKGLREAAQMGVAVLGTVADDAVKLGERAVEYGKGVLERAEASLKSVNCPGCNTAMVKDAEGAGYTCPSCSAIFTPKTE